MKQIIANRYLDAAVKTMLCSASIHIVIIIGLAVAHRDIVPLNYFDIIGLGNFLPAAIHPPLGHIVATLVLAMLYVAMFVTQETMTNRDIALQFLTLAAAGKVDEAYAKYVDMRGKHHNAYFAAGFETLRQAMKDAHGKTPNKTFTPKTIVCEGDLVMVHSCLVRAADVPNISVVHILKIRAGKIVELWDTNMEIPTQCPNTDGVF